MTRDSVLALQIIFRRNNIINNLSYANFKSQPDRELLSKRYLLQITDCGSLSYRDSDRALVLGSDHHASYLHKYGKPLEENTQTLIQAKLHEITIKN